MNLVQDARLLHSYMHLYIHVNSCGAITNRVIWNKDMDK